MFSMFGTTATVPKVVGCWENPPRVWIYLSATRGRTEASFDTSTLAEGSPLVRYRENQHERKAMPNFGHHLICMVAKLGIVEVRSMV